MLKGYRYFYVTNDVGYKIRDIIVLGDKTYRKLFKSAVVLRRISYKKYIRDKRELYGCLERLEEWLNLTEDKTYTFLKKRLKKINKYNFKNNLIDKKIKIYINTPYGQDLYNVGKKSDRYFRILFLGVKYSIVDISICEENILEFVSIADSVIDTYRNIYKSIKEV